MKPIDIARSAGVLPKAVRNYEAQGLLPPALRSPSGYRAYEQRHMDALHAFLLLVQAVGYRLARPIMIAIVKGDNDDALTHLDAAMHHWRRIGKPLTGLRRYWRLRQWTVRPKRLRPPLRSENWHAS